MKEGSYIKVVNPQDPTGAPLLLHSSDLVSGRFGTYKRWVEPEAEAALPPVAPAAGTETTPVSGESSQGAASAADSAPAEATVEEPSGSAEAEGNTLDPYDTPLLKASKPPRRGKR